MLSALEQASLAEAQAVMADRAEAKKTAPNLVAALHRGAAGGHVLSGACVIQTHLRAV